MAQLIRELMPPNPVALPGTASVHEAARAMRDADIGDVIIIDNNRVCGALLHESPGRSSGPWNRALR
jgi:CBS domain-containing protein